MDDQRYFLSWLENRGKTPWLITSVEKDSERLNAAILMYEHRFAGYGLRILAAFDETGRRSLVAPEVDSTDFAVDTCHKLLREGAQCILITFRHEEPQLDPERIAALGSGGMRLRWASREKELAGYLPLLDSLDETLAPMGMKTRKHMRYYMRRSAKELGAEFVATPMITLEEFLELNNASAYRATDEVARWRYNSFSTIKDPVLYGLRGGDGRWLSVIGGLHAGDYMELYWQMNREELKQYSIGTAMRAFMIEHEIARGTKRLYIEGGTSHTMSNAFVRERCIDLVLMRDHAASRAIPVMVKKFVPKENPLYEFLEHPELEWRSIGGS
jgi:hypothetical protein